MPIHTHPFFLLTLLAAPVACTPAVSPDSPTSERAAGNASAAKLDPSAADPSGGPVTVAVASVVLDDDCPDPAPSPVVAVPAAIKPAAAPKRARPPAGPQAPAEESIATSSFAGSCAQSRLQLTLENTGSTTAAVRITEIRLRDPKSDVVVAVLPSRRPTQWSQTANAYVDWDQSVPAGASAKASYSIAPPSWSAVEHKLGGSSRERVFDVEVALEVDGEAQMATSAEFFRPADMPVPPT